MGRKTWILLAGLMAGVALAGLLRPCGAQVRLPGRGLYLVGARDYMDVGGESALSFGGTAPYTIEAWVKPASGGTVLSKYTDQGKGEYFLRIWPDGRVVHHREVSPGRVVAKDLVVFGQYAHLAISYDGTNAHVLVNGRRTSMPFGGQMTDTATPVWIGAGRYDSQPGDFFSGVIDEVRVWNRALPDGEIQRHIQEVSLGQDRSGLVGYWNFDELDAEGRVPDLSGKGNHGVLKGRARLVDHETLGMVGGADRTVPLPGGATMDFMWVPPGGKVAQGFYMSKYEVTYAQYVSISSVEYPPVFLSSDGRGEYYPYSNPPSPSLPVVVEWGNARRFISWLNNAAKDSLYRLPTESEWEYACGGNPAEIGDHAWYAGNSGDKPHEVGLKRPNRRGLHDMHGNVGEWVGDRREYSNVGIPPPGGYRDFYYRAYSYAYDRDYLSVARTPKLAATRTAMTWEAWIYQARPRVYQGIVEWEDQGNGPGTQFFLGGDILQAILVMEDGRRDTLKAGPVPLKAGTVPESWNHVALTYDGDTARIYLNGEEKGALAVRGPLKTTGKLGFGQDYEYNYSIGGQYVGFLDEVRVWDIALGVDRIRRDMKYELSRGLHPHLIVYYTFNKEGVQFKAYPLLLGWRYFNRFLKGGNAGSTLSQIRCEAEEGAPADFPGYDGIPYTEYPGVPYQSWMRYAGFRIVRIKK